MQVSVEKTSSVERRLTITVPANQVESAYHKRMSELAAKANIKGFRPGKAPMNVIQARFGDDARKEALGEVIQQALYEACAQHDLRPVSTPRVEPKLALADQPLEFTASFEVLPEVGPVQFSLKEIEKPRVEVSEEDLTRVLDQLRKQYTKWKLVDRPAREHDRVVIDYHAIFEGKSDADNRIQNHPLELGSKVMLPGFEEGLSGMTAGEERTLNLTFPTDLANDDKAGKPIEFVVTVKQVFEADMPALDEAFVKLLGVANGQVDELKQQIRQSLEQERDRLVKERLKEQIFRELLTQNPLELPASLVAREAKNIHDEVYAHHDHHDHHHSDEENKAFNDVAQKRVALGLLISEYAKHEKLMVDNAQVEKRIQEIASSYQNPAEVMEWLSSKERRQGIESQVAEDLVLEKLMTGIPVTEKVMTYAELKGIRI